MPHFVIDCSQSILSKASKKEIMEGVHRTALATGLFSERDIKVRVRNFEEFLVGGSNEDFIHVFGDIMEGRTIEQKANLSEQIVRFLKGLFPTVPNIAMNVRDFEKATYCNARTLQ